ncbi:MAG: UDPglucose 6-dehydrogenase, partial [Pseudonocardiales bacterium]|nr:UDPglucose 6-dehydrogenase [Pseudonocardiales bacterium]
LDWPALARVAATRTVVDTRNLLDPDVLRRAGFSWVGVGCR